MLTRVEWRRERDWFEGATVVYLFRLGESVIRRAQVVQKVGVSTGRVRQLMRFARLHPEIQRAILKIQPKKAKERLPKRLLRMWISQDEKGQLSQFRAYID